MKKLIFTLAVFFLPIAGHGIMAILGNEDARFFLHWSMLIASLIGSGFGCLIVCGAAALSVSRRLRKGSGQWQKAAKKHL